VVPPTLEGNITYSALVDYLCVSNKSENSASAIEFMNDLISKDVIFSLSQIPLLYKDLKLYGKFTGNNIENWYNTYERMIKNSIPYCNNNDLFLFTSQTIDKLINGGISAEEAARMLDDKAKMIVRE
jgi:hypothetical protein